MTKRTRFTALLDQGFTRSAAAQRVKVRSRSTAKRWHDAHLAAQAPEPQPTPAELEAHQARVRASQAKAQAEQEARRAQEVRCKRCGSPQPPVGVGCHCYRRGPEAPAQPSKVQPDFGPLDFRTQERHRVAVAEEAAVSDPHGRRPTNEELLYADQIWANWREEQIDKARQQIQAEQREQQRERDRRIEELSRPMWRPRGHRL